MSVIKKFDPGGKFTYNKLTKEYTVADPKQFPGTTEQVGKTLFGKWNPKSAEEFNSLAATIYSELLDKYGNTLSKEDLKGKARNMLENFHIKKSAIDSTGADDLAMETALDKLIDYAYNPTVSKSKTQVTMPNLDYLNYGSQEAYERDFSQLPNEQKSPILINHIKNLAEKYLAGSKQYPQWDYTHAADAQNIVDLFAENQQPSLEALLPYAYKFGWSPNSYLKSAAELKEEADEKAKQDATTAATLKAQQEQNQKTATKQHYITYGLSPETAELLVQNNYQEVDAVKLPAEYNNPKVAAAVKNWISSKGGKVFQDSQGRQVILNSQGFLNMPQTEFDEFSPARGLIWNQESGSVAFGNVPKPTKKFNTQEVELNWNPGQGFENYKLRGVNLEDNEWGWLNTLELYAPGNEQTPVILNRKRTQSPDGSYIGNYVSVDAQGKEQPYNIDLTGYGNEVQNTEEVNDDWAKYVSITAPQNLNDYDFATDYAIIKAALAENNYGAVEDLKAVQRLAFKLKNNLLKDLNHIRAAKELLNEYSTKPQIIANRIGGVLKGQKGLSFREYQQKLKKSAVTPNTSTDVPKQKRGFGNLEGTWKSMETPEKLLRTASIAGEAASFIPVYGAIGAGTTLVTDILADVVKDGFQWDDIANTNTALNAAMIGLSLIGLGGVKSFVKAGKIASEGIKFAEISQKAKKYQKALNLTDDGVEAIDDLASLGQKYNLKTTEELVAKVAELEKSGTNIGKAADGLELLQEVAKSSTKVQTALKTVWESTQKLATNKYTNYGLKTAAMLPGIAAAADQIPTAFKYGLEYTKPAELKNMAIAGSLGRTIFKDIQGVRALKNQLVENTLGTNKTTFKLGDQEFLVEQDIIKPKLKESRWFKNAKATKATNDALITAYKQSILKEVQKTAAGKNLTLSDLDNLGLDDFLREQKTGTGKYMLPLAPQPTTQNRFKDVAQYELAKKYWIKRNLLSKINRELQDAASIKVQSKNPNLFNYNLEEEVKAMQKTMAKYKRPSKPTNKILAKRKKQLEEYKNLQLSILNQKTGGILKYQNPSDALRQRYLNSLNITNPFESSTQSNSIPATTQTTRTTVPVLDTPTTFDTKAYGELRLPQNKNPKNYETIPMWQGDAYNNTWVPLIHSTMEQPRHVAALYNRLRSYTGEGKERVQELLNTWGNDPQNWKNQLVALNTDGARGPIHNVTYDYLETLNTPFNLELPRKPLLWKPTLPPQKPFDTPLKTTVTGNVTGGEVQNMNTENNGNNTPPFTPITPEPLNPWPMINTSVANASNFLGTLATNNRITALRNKAAAIIPHKGYLPYNFLRQDRQNTLASQGIAGSLRSTGARLGATTDVNQRIASGLTAEAQAGKIMFEGQKADLDRNTKIGTAQLQNNMAVNQYNQNAFDQNNMFVTQGMKEILNNNAQGALANRAAISTYTAQAAREANRAIDFVDMNRLYKESQNPDRQEALYRYQTEASPEAMAAKKAEYEALRTKSGGNMPEWENSPEYQDYMKRVQMLQNNMRPYVDKLQMLQTRQEFQNPFSLAKGGELTYSQKAKLEKQKAENMRRLKDSEMFYKMIMQNNEMLLKALRN